MEYVARGLTADWLNAWLAAIGATVIVPDLSLSWTEDPLPAANFTWEGSMSLPERIAHYLPSTSELERLAIARTHSQSSTVFDRNPSPVAFAGRAEVARRNGDYSLGMSLTDLGAKPGEGYVHSPFDPPAARGTTLWDRVVACRSALTTPVTDLDATLTGGGRRIRANGLGFDHRRFLSPADPKGDVWVDPVVECLAFCGLLIFPIRGNGTSPATRGWSNRQSRAGAFRWMAWQQPLNVTGIDALLDHYWNTTSNKHPTDFVSASITQFESLAYTPRATMDQTRGYASRRVR